MRVLQVTSGLDPRTGGTATAAISVALAARRAGIEVALAYPRSEGIQPALDRLAAAGVELHGFPFGTLPKSAAWGIAPALNRFLEERVGSYDLVHAHSVWVWSSVGAVRAARRAGKPVLIMPHEGLTKFDMARGSLPPLRWAKQGLRRWYLKRVDRWIVSSELERRESRLDDTGNAVALAHPVFDEMSAEPPPRPARPAGPPVLGFMGRFHPKKNLDLVIEALAAAPAVRLVAAGAGEPEFERELRARAEHLGVAGRIEWRGFVAAADRPAFLRSVDLMAMPSEFECFGLVAAESMEQGTPVLVSPNVGVAPDIEQAGCGAVVPATADALGRFLARADLAERIAEWAPRARPAALARYSFGAHGRALFDIYQSLG